MVNNIMSKPLGLVLILTAHMVFNGFCSHTGLSQERVGSLGDNITLEFPFNVSVSVTGFAIYKKKNSTDEGQKIAGYSKGKIEGNFTVYPKNMSVYFEMTNLSLSQIGIYWASLFVDGIIKKSRRIELDVQVNRSTVTPKPEPDSGNAGVSSFPFLAVLLVSSVVLLAAVLPLLIWCILRHKDKQPAPAQQSSNPTAQETVANIVPAPPLVYSVLDFPKRTSAVMEMNSSQTEYAAISYLPEKRQG